MVDRSSLELEMGFKVKSAGSEGEKSGSSWLPSWLESEASEFSRPPPRERRSLEMLRDLL